MERAHDKKPASAPAGDTEGSRACSPSAEARFSRSVTVASVSPSDAVRCASARANSDAVSAWHAFKPADRAFFSKVSSSVSAPAADGAKVVVCADGVGPEKPLSPGQKPFKFVLSQHAIRLFVVCWEEEMIIDQDF